MNVREIVLKCYTFDVIGLTLFYNSELQREVDRTLLHWCTLSRKYEHKVPQLRRKCYIFVAHVTTVQKNLVLVIPPVAIEIVVNSVASFVEFFSFTGICSTKI